MHYLCTSPVWKCSLFEVQRTQSRIKWYKHKLVPYPILQFHLSLACCASSHALCYCLVQQRVTFYSFADQSNDSNMTGQTDINHDINSDLYGVYLGNVNFYLSLNSSDALRLSQKCTWNDLKKTETENHFPTFILNSVFSTFFSGMDK